MCPILLRTQGGPVVAGAVSAMCEPFQWRNRPLVTVPVGWGLILRPRVPAAGFALVIPVLL